MKAKTYSAYSSAMEDKDTERPLDLEDKIVMTVAVIAWAGTLVMAIVGWLPGAS